MAEVLAKRSNEDHRTVYAYSPRKEEKCRDRRNSCEFRGGVRRRARSESSPPTQPRESLISGARQSVEFLLCEVLDDIVNLPKEAIGEESSDTESEILEEISMRHHGFRPWRSIGVVGGIAVGFVVTVFFR